MMNNIMKLSRVANTFARSSHLPASRLLTTSTSNSVNKLRSAVEDYRMKNYSEELPSRCKKEIIDAADFQRDGHITIDGILTIVTNIGAGKKVLREDIERIMSELGEKSHENRTIDAETMLQIL
mmetsp:Transcript_1305/g.2008  ORF Transcript_1305/g.2008 Transcript_1305/m.2008 type:complete len:124 (+) Transcript_1305:97-468(+)